MPPDLRRIERTNRQERAVGVADKNGSRQIVGCEQIGEGAQARQALLQIYRIGDRVVGQNTEGSLRRLNQPGRFFFDQRLRIVGGLRANRELSRHDHSLSDHEPLPRSVFAAMGKCSKLSTLKASPFRSRESEFSSNKSRRRVCGSRSHAYRCDHSTRSRKYPAGKLATSTIAIQ